MFAQTLVEFADYLNQVGYAITPDKTADCIASFTDDMDCTDAEDVIGATRFYFCTNRNERLDLPVHFKDFIKHREMISNAKDNKKKIDSAKARMSEQEDSHQKRSNEINDKIKNLEEEAKQIEEKVKREWKPDPTKFTAKDLKFLEKAKPWIDKLDMPNVEDILSGKGVSAKESQAAQKQVMKMAEQAMMKNDLTRMEELTNLFNILKKVKKTKLKEEPMREKAIKEATADTLEKIRELKEKKRQEDAEHKRLQRMLSERIAELNRMSIISKPQAIEHRVEFKEARNAIRTYNELSAPPEAEKEFKSLTAQDKATIMKYIHDNILKFKTRLTRNIANLDNGQIDMGRTIKNACRTGGLPMDIYKELKKPGKANLILMLDVSGSCKEASEMMITFMYLLQEVFPRGCRAYAFVDSLYDITDIMHAKNAEQAIKETLNIIPRRGVYSNYERPIKELWNLKTKITKDSIVIVIGDARNNKNGPAENEFRNIARRAKKTYWLNTDYVQKWNQGDSIAGTYAKYSKMFEIRTPKAIVQFLNEGMK